MLLIWGELSFFYFYSLKFIYYKVVEELGMRYIVVGIGCWYGRGRCKILVVIVIMSIIVIVVGDNYIFEVFIYILCLYRF